MLMLAPGAAFERKSVTCTYVWGRVWLCYFSVDTWKYSVLYYPWVSRASLSVCWLILDRFAHRDTWVLASEVYRSPLPALIKAWAAFLHSQGKAQHQNYLFNLLVFSNFLDKSVLISCTSWYSTLWLKGSLCLSFLNISWVISLHYHIQLKATFCCCVVFWERISNCRPS